MPGEKIEKLEGLIRSFLVGPTRVAYRKMARVTGKILSMSCAVSCARMFTRETYRCIRPEGDWDAEGDISQEMIEELREALKRVRVFNAKGSHIRRPAKQVGLRLMMDASRAGFGYRLDGEQRDVKWGDQSYMVSAEWSGDVWEDQAHRELAALLEIMEGDDAEVLLGDKRVLLWTDSIATRAYVNKGSGSSMVMTGIMKRVWAKCLVLGCSVLAEHVKGELLVEAGVDAFSRATEFRMARKQFLDLHNSEKFGRRGGFSGFTVDALASQKTKQVKRYMSRGGIGLASEGDYRVAQLEETENFYVCPPLGFVEQTVRRLEEAGVAATVVVPNWVGKPWHLWLRERAIHVEVLEWSAFPAVWWDVSEKKKKPHVLAQRWEFVVFAVDFRAGSSSVVKGVEPVQRWKDSHKGGKHRPVSRLELGRLPSIGRLGHNRSKVWSSRKVFRVLSLCGGMGTVGYALRKVRHLMGLDVTMEVLEIELDPVARAVADTVGGGRM